MPLYEHKAHPHIPKNVNASHAEEQQGINAGIAVVLTRTVGTMQTAYLFVILAFVGLLGILGTLSPIVALLVAWTSQTLIQLCLLPVIMVSQNVLNRKTELQAEESFNTTLKSFHDIEQIKAHLDAQDTSLVSIENTLRILVDQQKGKET